ncbi:MAG: tetratricopeptide repeat protein [Candidatus Moranbacteria bacterium]|nr:tetratricopeptide repeat protein [Candidatus Moranbacteria bacterium]
MLGTQETTSFRQEGAERPSSVQQSAVRQEHSTPQSGQKSSYPVLSRVLDAVITTSLVAIFFGIPVFFTGFSLQGIAFDKQLYFYFWLLIGLVAWVSKGVAVGEMRVRRTPLDIPVLAFLGVYGLATALSVNRWTSFWGSFGDPSRGFLSVAALVLAYFLITSHYNRKRAGLMFGGIVVSSLLVTLWSFLAVMGIRFLPAVVEPYAPISLLGTLTTLSTFLAAVPVVLMTALFLAFREDGGIAKTWKRWAVAGFLLAGLLLDLFLLLALYSFVTWPVVIGGLGFFLIFILAQIVRPAEQWVWVPMAAFVVVFAFLMFGSVRIARVNLPVEVIPKLSFAFDIAKEAVRHKFFLGSGPATYGSVFSLYRPVEYNQNSLFTLRFDQTPGIFLEALSTIGVVGTIAYLVLALSFVSVGIYLLSRNRSRNKILSLGLWSLSMMFFIGSFIAAFNGPILLFASVVASLSIVTALAESGSEERFLSLSLKASPKFALALAFIFMVVSAGVAFLFVFLGKVLVADISAGRVARSSQVDDQSVAGLGRAASLNPQERQYLVSLGQTYIALANREAAKPEGERDTDKVAAYIREAFRVTEIARTLAPEDVRTAEALGLIYESGSLYSGDVIPKAVEAYQKASDLEPSNPVLLVKIGQLKRAQADQMEEGKEKKALYQEAVGYFDQAIGKKDDFGLAYYNRAVAESRVGSYEEAIGSAQKAVDLESQNVTFRYALGSAYQLRKQDGDLDRAESIYLGLLKENEKLVDVRLALGLLYEQKKDQASALVQYRKLIDSIPDGSDGDALRKQVGAFIDTLEKGGSNVDKSAPQQAESASAPEASNPPVPSVPTVTSTPQAGQ